MAETKIVVVEKRWPLVLLVEVHYGQCENGERVVLLDKKKNEKHWMTDSMSLPKKKVSFFQRAMKIEVSENMVTPNILLKRQ